MSRLSLWSIFDGPEGFPHWRARGSSDGDADGQRNQIQISCFSHFPLKEQEGRRREACSLGFFFFSLVKDSLLPFMEALRRIILELKPSLCPICLFKRVVQKKP